MKFNLSKVSKILKSRVFIGIVAIVIGYNIGHSSVDSYRRLLKDLESENKKIVTDLETKNEELEELRGLVEEAQPFFDMQEEEQAKLAEQAEKEKAERLAKEEEERKAKEQAEIDAKSVTLSNGNYIAGTDFDAGTYDIVAISGGGNVSSDNMFTGGINAIMGTANDGFYEKEYKNIKLPTGTTLSIDGVKIKLVPKL